MTACPTVSEVAENFSEYLDRVAHGERFVLMHGSQPVAELTPVKGRPRLRDLPAILKSLPHLAPEDLDGFDADLAAARRGAIQAPIR
jgi:antitoxin (DNA-binding transcriptional repressor) of toxin-antitoxin stability system